MCGNTSEEKKRRFGFGTVADSVRFCVMMIVRLFVFAVLALALAVVVMWLWNWLMPGLLNAAAITYWQAFGLMILARLVLGTFGLGWGVHRWRARRDRAYRFAQHRQMCGDMGRSERFNDTMTWWHNYKRFWKDEGKAAFDTYLKRTGEEKTTEGAGKK